MTYSPNLPFSICKELDIEPPKSMDDYNDINIDMHVRVGLDVYTLLSMIRKNKHLLPDIYRVYCTGCGLKKDFKGLHNCSCCYGAINLDEETFNNI